MPPSPRSCESHARLCDSQILKLCSKFSIFIIKVKLKLNIKLTFIKWAQTRLFVKDPRQWTLNLKTLLFREEFRPQDAKKSYLKCERFKIISSLFSFRRFLFFPSPLLVLLYFLP